MSWTDLPQSQNQPRSSWTQLHPGIPSTRMTPIRPFFQGNLGPVQCCHHRVSFCFSAWQSPAASPICCQNRLFSAGEDCRARRTFGGLSTVTSELKLPSTLGRSSAWEREKERSSRDFQSSLPSAFVSGSSGSKPLSRSGSRPH